MTRRILAAIAIIASLAPASAFADDPVRACIAAVDRGQAARRKSALRDARAAFIECARDVCPAPIRADCTRWLEDVDARLPSVSIRVASETGEDIAGTITVDGAPVTIEAGRSLSLDPGPHVIRAQATGYEPAEQHIVLLEGERARVVTMSPKALVRRVAPPPAPPPTPPPPVQAETKHTPGVLTLALAGVGVVGLAGFTGFGLSGRSQANDLKDGCGTTHTCDPKDVDSAKSKYLVADVSLGVGVVALAAALVVWLTVDYSPRDER
jgi:hypothetical protein